jgi:predicted N-acetyltransferase YhbS
LKTPSRSTIEELHMPIHLRLARPDDYRATEELTREAFWGLNHPGCDEHLLVHKLREVPAFVRELDYVAEVNVKLVGHVIYSKARIVDEAGHEHETLTFGPLSVPPEHQNQGVGKALMMSTIVEARRLGYHAIVVFGHPDYYPRFGFRRAAEFGITTANGDNFDAFMAMPLHDGALDGVTGRFYEDPVFEVNANEVDEFDKGFPYKEKQALTSIDVLLDRLEPAAREALLKLNIKWLCHLRGKSEYEVSELPGIDKTAMDTIRATMREYGFRWGDGSQS